MDTRNVKIQVLARVDTPVINAMTKPKDMATALRHKYNQFKVAKRDNLGEGRE